MTRLELTYYCDMLSSWCLIADRTLDKIRERYGDRIEYQWKIAMLGPIGYTPDGMAFAYRRTNHITGVRLNAAWIETVKDSSLYPCLAAEAARTLGRTDDRVRRALAHAALIDGEHTHHKDVAIAVAARAGGLERAELEKMMDDAATLQRVSDSSAEFAALNVPVRPTTVLRNAIGDTSILSGIWSEGPLAACVESMLHDIDRYEEFMSANPGEPPRG